MYCNCKDITGIWSPLNQRIFQILEQLYKEKHPAIRKRNYPMVEIIRKEAELHGNNEKQEIDHFRGADIFYIQLSGCRCKNRPLLRLSEKCLELNDEQLKEVLTKSTDNLEKGIRESYTIDFPQLDLHKI